jgi:Tfp pilus assembly protein PilV
MKTMHMLFVPSARRRRGFTIIEALISIVIAAGAVLAFVGMIPYGFEHIQVNASQVQAIALGQRYLDTVRNAEESSQPLPSATTVPVDQGDSFVTGAANASSPLFTITPDTCPVVNSSTYANQHDCSVTVTWTQNNESETIKVETYVTR